MGLASLLHQIIREWTGKPRDKPSLVRARSLRSSSQSDHFPLDQIAVSGNDDAIAYGPTDADASISGDDNIGASAFGLFKQASHLDCQRFVISQKLPELEPERALRIGVLWTACNIASRLERRRPCLDSRAKPGPKGFGTVPCRARCSFSGFLGCFLSGLEKVWQTVVRENSPHWSQSMLCPFSLPRRTASQVRLSQPQRRIMTT